MLSYTLAVGLITIQAGVVYTTYKTVVIHSAANNLSKEVRTYKDIDQQIKNRMKMEILEILHQHLLNLSAFLPVLPSISRQSYARSSCTLIFLYQKNL